MELSEKTGIMPIGYEDIDDNNQYDTIIYLGALYAGGVLGMKITLNKIRDVSDKKIIITTVGLADPTNTINTDNIRESVKKQIKSDIYNHSVIHFLRGGIDYSNLSFKHRTMIALLNKRAKRLKGKDRTPEVEAMIETYGKKVSFIDFDALDNMIDDINSLH